MKQQNRLILSASEVPKVVEKVEVKQSLDLLTLKEKLNLEKLEMGELKNR